MISIIRCHRLAILGALGALLLLACEPEVERHILEDKRETCTSSDQCPSGEVCKEGLCIIGDCVVREDCPKPNDQMCNELNRCVPDPDSPIGNQCPNGDRDCDMGEFCSAGTCYDVASSETCSRSSDCSAGSRCDPVNGFCVEDRGGCNRGDEYPELACPEGDVCDALTGHCEPPTGIPCTPETELEDCGEALRCLGSRCVQCTSNTSCGEGDNICCDGFGTQCNVATGRCVSAFVCSDHPDCTDCLQRPGLGDQSYCSDGRSCGGDADCSHLTDRRCAASTGECIRPECVDDNECHSEQDSRWVCDPATFRCFLPPATCEETNEPNNAISTASVVSGTEYSDVLCRGDIDVLEIQGHANTRLRVYIGLSPATSADGISATLRDAAGLELDTDTVIWSTDELRVQSDVAADAPYYVVLQGNATEADMFNYTITIEELEPLQCDSEPGEPNNTFAEAGNSVVTEGSSLRALCGVDDEDFHQLLAPATMRTQITVNFLDSEGDIEIELLDEAGVTLDSSDSYGDSESVRYTAGESDATLILRIARDVYWSWEEEQEYTIVMSSETPPDCSDGFEPNNTIAQAAPVDPGSHEATICDMDDEDYFAVSLPGGGDISATVTFVDAEGDLELKLVDAEGSTLDSSTTTSSVEDVQELGLDPGVYYVRVYPYSYSSPDPDRQPYTLDVEVNHFCFDDELEGFGNNSISQAVSLRDDAFDSYYLEETLKHCGPEEDWYRLLLLGDELFEIELSGAEGTFAEVYQESAEGAELVAATRELSVADGISQSYLGYHVPGRGALYYVRIAGGGSEERSYDLKMTAYLELCGEDAQEFNDTEALATLVPAEGLSVSGLLCGERDVDVFQVPVTVDTEVDVTVSFDADQGDIDLLAVQTDQVIDYTPVENSGPDAQETLRYVAEVPGDLFVSIVRRDPADPDPIDYAVTVDVVGAPVEDAGFPDAGLEPDAGGEDAGFEDAGFEDAAAEDGSAEDGGEGVDGGA